MEVVGTMESGTSAIVSEASEIVEDDGSYDNTESLLCMSLVVTKEGTKLSSVVEEKDVQIFL